jgi:hypothetical protein
MIKGCVVFSSVCLMVALTSSAALAQNGAAVNQTPGQGVTLLPRVHRQTKKQIARPQSNNNGQNSTIVAAKPVTRQQQQPALSFSDAQRRFHRQRHDRAWWKSHYRTIVFVTGGYYYWDAGYWFPAWGYDPVYDYYDNDGPIFTYGNLLPDQVIINVQKALQQLGYYNGGLNGSIGPPTRAAIVAYQQDAGLIVTGGIDAPTVSALGLY